MSETPTPSLLQDWLREKANAPYFAAYRGDLLSIAHALDSLHGALTAERTARERAEAERGALAEALRRIRPYAEQEILDCCADIQEGGKGAGLDDWSSVVDALAALERGDGKEADRG